MKQQLNIIFINIILSSSFNSRFEFSKSRSSWDVLCGKQVQTKAICHLVGDTLSVSEVILQMLHFSMISKYSYSPFQTKPVFPGTMIPQHIISHKRLPHDLYTAFVTCLKLYHKGILYMSYSTVQIVSSSIGMFELSLIYFQ